MEIQALLSNASGRQLISSYFNTCEVIETDLDVANFMSNIMGFWMESVQYNTDLPSSIDIATLCNIMDDNTKPLISRYVSIVQAFNPGACIDVSYDNMIKQLQNISVSQNMGVGARQWVYQTCAEFGYFQTTDSPNQPFGNLVPLSFYIGICRDAFGFNWIPRITETNGYYGGNQPGGSRILFVNGGLDPWASLSVTKSISPELPALYIPGTSHCANYFRPKPGDPPSLAMAQAQILQQIHDWLAA